MNGAEALVAALREHGVDTVFGLPGVQMDPLFNAFYDAKAWLRVVNARHEQGVAYMALGAAQATGAPAVYACVPGPGFLNTAAALSTAYAVQAPVLALVGQIRSDRIGLGGGELHELPDQTAIVRGLTRWSAIARDADDIRPLVKQAFAALAAGRAPVAIEAPPDILRGCVGQRAAGAPAVAVRSSPDPATVEEAARRLHAACSPLIFVGSGAIGAGATLKPLAERLQAPVISHLQGRGVLPSDDPLSMGMAEACGLWRQADVVLAIGTRLHGPLMDWGMREGQRLVRIDIDPLRFRRLPNDLEIEADAQDALPLLLQALKRCGAPHASRIAEFSQRKAAAAAAFEAGVPLQMAYLRALRSALPSDAVVVADYTQVGYVAASLMPVEAPRRILSPGYQGTLGFAYATALGAKAACPAKTVVSLSGDGGFLFTANEMATAVQHGLGVVAVVFNDGAYGNVRRMQQDLYGGRVIASDLHNPDFLLFAESFGVAARRVDSPDEFRRALDWAIAQSGPSLIEVRVGKMPSPWALLEPDPE